MLTLKQAIDTYLAEAYPSDEIPVSVLKLLDEIRDYLDDPAALERLDACESLEPGIIAVRLGNHRYPHMKLVVRFTDDGPVFSVDTHDGPERIPPTLPGYEALKPVITANSDIKDRIHRKLRDLRREAGTVVKDEDMRGDILVVDDEPFVGEIMRRLLGSLRFRVHYAASASEGHELVQKHRFVCCFLDIMMPGESGYEFLEKLSIANQRSFPVVFVTGMHPDSIQHDMADDTILKPFTRAMLQERLEQFGLLAETV